MYRCDVARTNDDLANKKTLSGKQIMKNTLQNNKEQIGERNMTAPKIKTRKFTQIIVLKQFILTFLVCSD